MLKLNIGCIYIKNFRNSLTKNKYKPTVNFNQVKTQLLKKLLKISFILKSKLILKYARFINNTLKLHIAFFYNVT